MLKTFDKNFLLKVQIILTLTRFLCFNGLNFVGYVIQVEQQFYYLNHSWEDKGVHTISRSISPKGNALAWLEFELSYLEGATINNHGTGTTPVYLL